VADGDTRDDPRRPPDELKKAEAERRRMLDNLPVLSWRGLPDGLKGLFKSPLGTTTPVSRLRRLTFGLARHGSPDDVGPVGKRWWSRCFGEAGAGGSAPAAFRRRVSLVPCRASPCATRWGTIVFWYGTDTDIETAKGRRASYGGCEQELRRMIDAIPQTIVVLTLNGTPSPRINRRSTLPVSRSRP